MKTEMEGIASIALLPSGSISGHFVHPASSTCLGLYGTEIPCERECSRAEDYRLINLTIFEFRKKKEMHVIVECRGQDATRFHNVSDIHGWEEDVIDAARSKQKHNMLEISFDCEILKADQEAENHIRRFLPALVNRAAVVNIGTMVIKGLDFESRTTEPDVLKCCKEEIPQVCNSEKQHQECTSVSESSDLEFDSHNNVVEVKSTAEMQLGPTKLWSKEESEIEKFLQEELQAEGLSETPLVELSWKEDPSGWRTKEHVIKGYATSELTEVDDNGDAELASNMNEGDLSTEDG